MKTPLVFCGKRVVPSSSKTKAEKAVLTAADAVAQSDIDPAGQLFANQPQR